MAAGVTTDANGFITGWNTGDDTWKAPPRRSSQSSISRGRYGGMLIDVEGLEKLGADLERFANQLPRAVRDSLRGAGGEALATEMRLRAPRRSGELVSNIGVHTDGAGLGGSVLVGYQGALSHGHRGGGRFQQGAWVESGTKPHTIKAHNAEALFFGGKAVEQVEHPGMRGQGVARKSIKAAEWEVLADIVDKLNEVPGGN